MLARPILIGVLGAIVIVVAFALNYYLSVNEEVDHAARQDTGANKPVVKSSKKAGTPAAPRTAAKGTPTKPTATAQSPAAGTTTSKPVLNSQNPAVAVAPVQPSFDIVRVDPEGNTVIAGRASAHSSIEILDGETVIGKATADARGEWIFVPEAKLEPGKRVLALRSTDKQGETAASDTAVIVVIPEPGKDIAGKKSDRPSTPLAMAVPRGDAAASKPSVILQAPTATEPKPATAASASTVSTAKEDNKTQTAMAAPATTTPAAAPTTTTKAVTPPAAAASTATGSTTTTSAAKTSAAKTSATKTSGATAPATAAPAAAAPATTALATTAPATTAPATTAP
ncbi:MAG: hypothetical protein HOL85_21050, partial [Rhodospirillaceae bacterium]|nr:hypothetical protein [Rhodospirillaceae bacterium]